MNKNYIDLVEDFKLLASFIYILHATKYPITGFIVFKYF